MENRLSPGTELVFRKIMPAGRKDPFDLRLAAREIGLGRDESAGRLRGLNGGELFECVEGDPSHADQKNRSNAITGVRHPLKKTEESRVAIIYGVRLERETRSPSLF